MLFCFLQKSTVFLMRFIIWARSMFPQANPFSYAENSKPFLTKPSYIQLLETNFWTANQDTRYFGIVDITLSLRLWSFTLKKRANAQSISFLKSFTVLIWLLSTCLVKPNFDLSLFHQHSTTLSLETRIIFRFIDCGYLDHLSSHTLPWSEMPQDWKVESK